MLDHRFDASGDLSLQIHGAHFYSSWLVKRVSPVATTAPLTSISYEMGAAFESIALTEQYLVCERVTASIARWESIAPRSLKVSRISRKTTGCPSSVSEPSAKISKESIGCLFFLSSATTSIAVQPQSALRSSCFGLIAESVPRGGFVSIATSCPSDTAVKFIFPFQTQFVFIRIK